MAWVRHIEARWGLPIAQLLSDLAEQGLTRKQTAAALGTSHMTIYREIQHLDADPFGTQSVAAAFVQDTGMPLGAEIRRLRDSGLRRNDVARAIGYADGRGLARMMEARGIEVEFETRDRLTVYCESQGRSAEECLRDFPSLAAAARAMGYADRRGLDLLLQSRGIEYRPPPRAAKPVRIKQRPEDHPWRKRNT